MPSKLQKHRNDGTLDLLYRSGYLSPTVYKHLDILDYVEGLEKQGWKRHKAVVKASAVFVMSVRGVQKALAQIKRTI